MLKNVVGAKNRFGQITGIKHIIGLLKRVFNLLLLHLLFQPVPGESQPAARLLQDMDDDDKNGKQKRGVLPKQATQVMKSWLFQHIVVSLSLSLSLSIYLSLYLW